MCPRPWHWIGLSQPERVGPDLEPSYSRTCTCGGLEQAGCRCDSLCTKNLVIDALLA
jgi:hypothetical protein